MRSYGEGFAALVTDECISLINLTIIMTRRSSQVSLNVRWTVSENTWGWGLVSTKRGNNVDRRWGVGDPKLVKNMWTSFMDCPHIISSTYRINLEKCLNFLKF